MRDRGKIKIICRVLTLFVYILTIFLIFMEASVLPELDITILPDLKESYLFIITICTIPLIIMMIIALIIKYKFEEESKVNPYRIVDVLTRLVSTMPITLIASYYLFDYFNLDIIPNIAMGIIIFIILDYTFKFTLQETMSVSFITSDSL
ncbi:MAG: hypothetical protein K2J90_02300 [Lachnospiraceae bacterium]|nr:hypothetical protein [Lachnospiraceae bacterium]